MSAFGHSHPWAQRNGRQRGKERGCCSGTFRLHVRLLSSGQRANGHECRKGGREGGKGEGEEERRLLKVGGKFGSAAKLTQLSSPLLKRNFGSPTPALPAWLPASAWLALHPLPSLLFLPCAFALSLSLPSSRDRASYCLGHPSFLLYPFLRCSTNKQCVLELSLFRKLSSRCFAAAIDRHRPARDRCHSRLPSVLLSPCTGRVNLGPGPGPGHPFCSWNKTFSSMYTRMRLRGARLLFSDFPRAVSV